jgi:hypothetical protein
MRKTLMLTVVLLLSAAWLQAQDNMGKSSGAASTTIQGCLSRDGSYFYLTDSSGKKHHLVGYNAKQINEHVGHTVEITGTPTIKTTDTTVTGNESTAKETPVFKVKSVKHIADTCKAAM